MREGGKLEFLSCAGATWSFRGVVTGVVTQCVTYSKLGMSSPPEGPTDREYNSYAMLEEGQHQDKTRNKNLAT